MTNARRSSDFPSHSLVSRFCPFAMFFVFREKVTLYTTPRARLATTVIRCALSTFPSSRRTRVHPVRVTLCACARASVFLPVVEGEGVKTKRVSRHIMSKKKKNALRFHSRAKSAVACVRARPLGAVVCPAIASCVRRWGAGGDVSFVRSSERASVAYTHVLRRKPGKGP